MNYLRKGWDRITNNGVDNATQGREVIKIRLLNQLIFIAFVTSTLAMITQFSTGASIANILTTLANLIIEGIAIYFAYLKRHTIVRFLACFVFPTMIACHVIILGGNFGEANIFTGLAFMNLIIFDDKKEIQLPLVIYTCVLFILSRLYVVNYSIEAAIAKNPYDEIITFPMVILILGLIILLYQNSIESYEEQQLLLITNLEQKNQELVAINDELEQFTYIASHDLKTPLRTINGHVGLAKKHLQQHDYGAIHTDLDFISQGAKQMYALISGILEYKLLDNQNSPREILDLNEVVTIVLTNLETLISQKGAKINVLELPRIRARHSDIVILLQNLIENGIKYNESSPPTIDIRVDYQDHKLILSVADNGIGIAKEYHQKIFQFFKRLHTQEQYEGTGIGLGLCKKLVQTYNGQMRLSSAENKGAIFQIIFPREVLVVS